MARGAQFQHRAKEVWINSWGIYFEKLFNNNNECIIICITVVPSGATQDRDPTMLGTAQTHRNRPSLPQGMAQASKIILNIKVTHETQIVFWLAE